LRTRRNCTQNSLAREILPSQQDMHPYSKPFITRSLIGQSGD